MSRDQELAQLANEQDADDTHTQRPEEHGGNHGTPVLSVEALGLDVGEQVDGMSVSGQGLGSDYDEANGPALTGRFVQARLGPLWGHVSDVEGDAARIVREAIAELSEEDQETFRLVYGERLSLRAAAERLDVSYMTVSRRCDALKRIVTRALVQAAGGESEVA